jgi:NAD+ kinase
MKIAVFSKSMNSRHQNVYDGFFEVCSKLGIEYIVNQEFNYNNFTKKYIPDADHLFSNKHDLLSGKVDFVFSIGGDGTFLEATLIVKDSGIPMLGINTGRLGFLANNPKYDFEYLFKKLIEKDYRIEKRTLLELKSDKDIFGENSVALNDFTILKRDNSSLTEIATYIDGDYFNTYWGDGLIVSTPTGSSAYSLSCGGPIVYPGSDVFIVTPVAPHNLSLRPVILPDNVELSFKVKARERNYLVTLDSRYKVIDQSYQIKIQKAKYFICNVRFNNQSFSEVLREKLSWGKDNRNT